MGTKCGLEGLGVQMLFEEGRVDLFTEETATSCRLIQGVG